MFNKKIARAGAVLGFALSAIAPALPAAAAVPPDVFKDSSGNVYVHGATATAMGSQAQIQTNEPLVRSVRAGYCGEIRIAPTSSIPNIGTHFQIGAGAVIDAATLPVRSGTDLPRCSGNAFTPSAATSFKDDQGRIVLVGNTPGISYQVTYQDVNSSQSARPNACGFFRLSNTQSNPLPSTLIINGSSHNVSSLPVALPPICQSQSNGNGGRTYTRYIPATW